MAGDNEQAKEEKLEIMRHSTSHIMAEAVQYLFPDAKFAIGPAIEDGFYYDFDLPRPLNPDDLPLIENKMKEIIAANGPFIRREVTKEEARQSFGTQPYKLELIDELPDDEKISLYQQGSFLDLCRGPHVGATGEIKVKIVNTSWRTIALAYGDDIAQLVIVPVETPPILEVSEASLVKMGEEMSERGKEGGINR